MWERGEGRLIYAVEGGSADRTHIHTRTHTYTHRHTHTHTDTHTRKHTH